MRFLLVFMLAQSINIFGCYAVRCHMKLFGYHKPNFTEYFFDGFMIVAVTFSVLVAGNCIGY